MNSLGERRSRPALQQIVTEASRALALLDADRLEELARACAALTRDHFDPADLGREARGCAGDMAVLARVLEATRANLAVMDRLRDLHEGVARYNGEGRTEADHGDD